MPEHGCLLLLLRTTDSIAPGIIKQMVSTGKVKMSSLQFDVRRKFYQVLVSKVVGYWSRNGEGNNGLLKSEEQ